MRLSSRVADYTLESCPRARHTYTEKERITATRTSDEGKGDRDGQMLTIGSRRNVIAHFTSGSDLRYRTTSFTGDKLRDKWGVQKGPRVSALPRTHLVSTVSVGLA